MWIHIGYIDMCIVIILYKKIIIIGGLGLTGTYNIGAPENTNKLANKLVTLLYRFNKINYFTILTHLCQLIISS